MVWGNWAHSFTIPPFTQPVIDQAGMIESRTANLLNQDLISIYDSGGPQIAVLTLPSLEDQTIEERAIQVFDQWKIGKKGKDNGILVFIAKKEKKIRIEVGYGLEGDIPDAYSKRIIEDVMLPLFRRGEFTTGVLLGIQQITLLAKVDLKTAKIPKRQPKGLPQGQLLLWLFLVFIIYGLSFSQNRKRFGSGGRYRGPYIGGGWGGGGGFGGGGWSGGGGSSGGGGASGGW